MCENIFEMSGIYKYFSLGTRRHAALDGLSLTVRRGETLGLLGESGCGKSTLARVMMGVYRPDAGTLLFDGKKQSLRGHRERLAFARRAQMIFQDPYQSLDPRMKAGDILAENLVIQGYGRDRCTERVRELLDLTGLPQDSLDRFPYEFSGGQRQRIGIARAISTEPEFLLCDEPVSALDASVRRQIMELLAQLRAGLGLSCLFISHDVEVLRDFSDRIAVMYSGQIVELADAIALCSSPVHPYTELLLDSVLSRDPALARAKLKKAAFEPASIPMRAQVGCAFAPRCPRVCSRCHEEKPELIQQGDGRYAACHML